MRHQVFQVVCGRGVIILVPYDGNVSWGCWVPRKMIPALFGFEFAYMRMAQWTWFGKQGSHPHPEPWSNHLHPPLTYSLFALGTIFNKGPWMMWLSWRVTVASAAIDATYNSSFVIRDVGLPDKMGLFRWHLNMNKHHLILWCIVGGLTNLTVNQVPELPVLLPDWNYIFANTGRDAVGGWLRVDCSHWWYGARIRGPKNNSVNSLRPMGAYMRPLIFWPT